MAKVNNMICAAAPEDVFLIIELKKRLARIGIRRPNSQLGPALRLTTGRANFYIYTNWYVYIRSKITVIFCKAEKNDVPFL